VRSRAPTGTKCNRERLVPLQKSATKASKRVLTLPSRLGGYCCDTPGVSFVLRREICPNLGCSVKISISRSRMPLIIQTIHTQFTEFGVIRSRETVNLEPVKTFISRNECKLDDQSRFINLI
jgi:hypothetical protein